MSKKDSKLVLTEEESRAKLLEGARATYEAVTTTYGPKGQNVLIEKPFGRPVLTRDGVTVAREVYFSERAKNMGSQTLLEASETTNRIAGDGTTATIALSYHLLRRGVQAIAAGVHPMEVSRIIKSDSQVILDELKTLSKPVSKGQLQQVATVSSGDAALGQLISEAIERVGADGGITTEKAPITEVKRTYVDGYYLQTGFQALQAGKKELIDPFVIISIRRLSSAADAIELLNKVAQTKGLQPGNIPRLLIVGNLEDAAYNLIVDNINRGTIDAIIVKSPPAFGAMGDQLLEDISVYAGCSPLTDSINLRDFNEDHIGSIDRVVSSKSETTLFADNSTEPVLARIADIKAQMEDEISDAVNEKYRDRVAKLEGKIAIFKIGGATDGAKEELEFRVEDAIQATRAAFTDGVVPGGGATLITLSKLDISGLYRDSLQDTFKQLLINADRPAELGLSQMLAAPQGSGYNLREGEEIVDMVKSGILDPTLVLEQIVTNATSVVAGTLTVGRAIIIEDQEEA